MELPGGDAVKGPGRRILRGDNTVFTAALDKYFGGQPDKLTLDRL
jgi:hypothetical protein